MYTGQARPDKTGPDKTSKQTTNQSINKYKKSINTIPRMYAGQA